MVYFPIFRRRAEVRVAFIDAVFASVHDHGLLDGQGKPHRQGFDKLCHAVGSADV